MMADEVGQGRLPLAAIIEVASEAGQVLLTLSFADAVRKIADVAPTSLSTVSTHVQPFRPFPASQVRTLVNVSRSGR
jgi:hypothetical protein